MGDVTQSLVNVTLSKDPASNSFGVRFVEQSGELRLQNVEPGSRAEELGLSIGLRLVALQVGGMDYDVDSLKLRALASIFGRTNQLTAAFAPALSPAARDIEPQLSAEDPPVHTLQGLLDSSDVECIHAAALRLKETQAMHNYEHGSKGPHESLFLHENAFFQRSYPQLSARILKAMRDLHPSGQGDRLGVRCIEYHSMILAT